MMKTRFIKIGILSCILSTICMSMVQANDIELKIPKSSIQNAVDAFLHARYFSYGTETSSTGIDYYNIKPKSGTVTLLSGNRFELELILDAYINFELIGFEFDHTYSNKNVTIEGYVSIQTQGNGYKLLLVPDDFTFNESGLLYDALNLVSKGIVSSLPEISTTTKLPFLVSAATQYFTSTTPNLTTTTDEVRIGFTLKAGPRFITVTNVVNDNYKVGTVEKVDGVSGSTITSYDSPKTFEWNTGSTYKVQTPYVLLDETNGKNKFRHWVDKNGVVQNEISARRIQYTVTSQDETLKAIFDPAQRIQLDNSLEGGVYSSGTVTYDGSTFFSYDNYDFFHATQTKTIDTNVPDGTQGRNWKFLKWSDGNTSKQRNIVIDQDIDLKSEFKGSQVSNNSTTFKAYQSNAVRSRDGWQHMVYESLGHIWYEAKSPTGSWEFLDGPGGDHLDITSGKSPSIDVNTNAVAWSGGYWEYMTAIAWQDGGTIRLQTYQYNGSTYIDAAPYVQVSTGQSSSYDTQPNVIWTDNEELLLLYKTSSGLSYKIYAFNYTHGYLDQKASGTISNTSGAYNVATSSFTSGTHTWFDIVYEKDMGYLGPPYYVGTEIRHANLRYISGQSSATMVVSPHVISNSSIVRNKEPSVVTLSSLKRIVGWISATTTNSTWDPQNTRATIATLEWGMFGLTISRTNNDHHVRSVSVSKKSDNSEYYVAWSQIYDQSGYIDYNKFVKGSALNQFKGLNTKGWDVQITEAASANDIHAFSYYPKTQPYYWLQSNSLGSYLKQQPLATTETRGIILTDTAHTSGFNYSIGEIKLDDEPLPFVFFNSEEPSPSSNIDMRLEDINMKYQELQDVVEYLKSEPFQFSSDMQLTFEEQFSFRDSAAAVRLLGENGFIHYTVNLIDHSTNKILGILREHKIDGNSKLAIINKSWDVNPGGLDGVFRIEMVVKTNLKELYPVIENTYSDDNLQNRLQPEDFDDLDLDNSEVVSEYGLAQNYPNPFNPSTQIEYQIPTAGLVQLEVFDILGRKVQTLVNETQEIGKYTVTFNANGLASGVYLYRLSSGNFVTSKKLFLLK